MKKEILTLVIGILIGAIIATGIFLVLQNNSSSNSEDTMMTRGGGQMQEMDGNMTRDENFTPDGDMPADMSSETVSE